MPISRVRSVTDTSMMFMMPTPPTTSEMAAIAESMAVRLPVMMSITLAISTVLLTSKSFRLAGRDPVPLGQESA